MTLDRLPLLLVAGLALIFLICRQFRVRSPGGWRRAALLPVMLIGWGVINTTHPPKVGVLVLAMSGVGVGLGVILGVARGYATHIWRDPDGMVLQKGTIALAILWALSIAVRIGLSVVGEKPGFNQTETYADYPLFFGATLAAQNATISGPLRSAGQKHKAASLIRTEGPPVDRDRFSSAMPPATITPRVRTTSTSTSPASRTVQSNPLWCPGTYGLSLLSELSGSSRTGTNGP